MVSAHMDFLFEKHLQRTFFSFPSENHCAVKLIYRLREEFFLIPSHWHWLQSENSCILESSHSCQWFLCQAVEKAAPQWRDTRKSLQMSWGVAAKVMFGNQWKASSRISIPGLCLFSTARNGRGPRRNHRWTPSQCALCGHQTFFLEHGCEWIGHNEKTWLSWLSGLLLIVLCVWYLAPNGLF